MVKMSIAWITCICYNLPLMKKIFRETNKIGAYARTGVLNTRAGDVLTPTFMPDGTRGAVKSLSPEQVESTGVEIVLANTYHLHLNPGEKVIKKLGGLHSFANRKGPMLTDSGGFQVFSLDKHTKITEEGVYFTDPKTGDKHFISPEISMQIQIDLGADMIVAFDHLVGLQGAIETDVKDAFDRTHRWLERCTVEFKKLIKDIETPPLLFGVVQGGLDIELRKESLRIIQASDVDGVAIGGLSVGETREEMKTVLEALAPLYDINRPRFLLGVGTPEDLRIAVDNGIDMLDCVLPTRNARHGVVWGKNDERIHLTNEKYKEDSSVIEAECDCYTCFNGFSKAFLRHQFKSGDPIAGTLASIHNLRYMMRICEGCRK
jgi:queuine tRNA-ribosyltransferase